MSYSMRCFILLIVALSSVLAMPAQAGIVIQGTRVVYQAEKREVTIRLKNDDKKYPRLVQAWVDDGNQKLSADKIDVPFTLTPPVFRVEPGKGQVMRLVYTQEPLAADKESLFWLNVLEIPPRVGDGDTRLSFGFRTRLKLFFRPSNLEMRPEMARHKLEWSLVKDGAGQALEVRNPSPYFVSLRNAGLSAGGALVETESVAMVAPGDTQRFILKGAPVKLSADAEVKFSIVDDYGAFISLTAPLVSPSSL